MTAAAVYRGKTKSVGPGTEPDTLEVRYLDHVLGENGVIDPGADRVLLSLPGKGVKTAEAAARILARLEGAGIKTHFLRRLADDVLLVRRARRFPLEIVVRNREWGSYLRRHPRALPLSFLNGLTECFYKCDEEGDPLTSFDEAVTRQWIPRGRVETVVDLARRINELLLVDYDIVDFKVEFGLIAGEVAVIDELSADSMRLGCDGGVLGYEATMNLLAAPSGKSRE